AWSDLAVITAMVLFIVALICHAAEWGSARTVASRAERGAKVSTAQRRQRSLAKVSAAADGAASDTAETDSPEADDADETAESVAHAAEQDLSARERRIEMAGRLGLNISVIATLSLVLGVVLRGIAAGRAPWGNMYEYTISAVAIIAIAHVVM